MNNKICHITKKHLSPGEGYNSDFIHRELLQLIKKDHPDFNDQSLISPKELAHYRDKYLIGLITSETEELDNLENDVIRAISEKSIIADDISDKTSLSLGQKLADQVAKFGGSWTFIISFLLFVVIWMVTNLQWVMTKPLDPFPYILLNLILSCIAAIQAPVIMMSQNRLEEKDRERAKNDYKINLKAELEIRILHEKLDHLTHHQYKKLLNIQEAQISYL